jgi:hypothetical protein
MIRLANSRALNPELTLALDFVSYPPPVVVIAGAARALTFLLLSFLCVNSPPVQAQAAAPTRTELRSAISNLYEAPLCCSITAQQFAEDPQATRNGNSTPAVTDWDGLRRDTWYFMGAQLVSLAVIYTLPEDVSGWSDEQKDEFGFSKWKENVSSPQIDEDDFVINYVLHPYWGAAYYVRARERGFGKLNSFWYSVFLSTFYEAGPEAMFEKPSIQDLIVTPVFGAWLGEYFMSLRSDIRTRSPGRGNRSRSDNWLWYLTDPLDLVTVGVNRLFGRESELSFSPVVGTVNRLTANGSWLPASQRIRAGIGYPMTLSGLPTHSTLYRGDRMASDKVAGFSFSISW